MSDEYAAERKFLTKNYKAFLHNYLKSLKTGNEAVHIHPPPAFRDIYDLIIRHSVGDGDEINYSDIVSMMDSVAKFVSYLNRNGIEYDHFTECGCTRLTDKTVALLLESGGDSR